MTSCSLPKKQLEGKVDVKVVYVRTYVLYRYFLQFFMMQSCHQLCKIFLVVERQENKHKPRYMNVCSRTLSCQFFWFTLNLAKVKKIICPFHLWVIASGSCYKNFHSIIASCSCCKVF